MIIEREHGIHNPNCKKSLIVRSCVFTQLSQSMRKSSLSVVARQEATPRLRWQGKDCKSYCSKQHSSQGPRLHALSQPYPLRILTRYRYHIGESLLPSVRHYLRFIGAEQKLVEYGFKHKVWWPVVEASVVSKREIFLTPPIARCSYQVQSVQAGGMYVTHARISVHALICTYRRHLRHRLYCARTQQ